MFRRAITPETTVGDFAAAHARGALTVDCREPHEYVAGHVPGAVNIPLGQLGRHATSLRADDHGAPVFVICASGNRSKAAAALLVGLGLEALSVTGGTNEWVRTGHPVVTGTRRG